uniref:Mitotic spindle checkpoint protein MAD1 n=1 Tax=Opuntia streptacantha TaxID=393608 RepID=A0A7C9D2Y6_OPUST
MILRTPPPRKRRADSRLPESPPGSDRRLFIYEDPVVDLPESSNDHSDQMLCTYQCHQLVKSEFLDNYGSMEKAVSDYQSKIETLSHNLLKAEVEGKKYRDQFLYAEQELAAARGREQALQEKVLKQINDSQEGLKRQIQQCHELEMKLRNEESMRKKVESTAASAEEKAHLLESKLKHLSATAEREKKSLEKEVKHLREDSKLSIPRLRADLQRVECRAHNAEKESELLKEKLEEASDQLKKCLLEKADVEKKLTSFTYLKESTTSQSDILVKHLQEELRDYESEVREARKLKASHEDVELLKEKLVEEKSRRERVEAELLKLREIQLSMEMLEDESSKKVMKDIPGVLSSDDSPVKFVALQKEVIDSMARMSEANARLKQLEVALTTAELDKKNAETEVALLKEKEESLKSEVKRLESRLGHGDFSAANTKVLRMVNALGVDNEARQTIEALQSELQKANEKLKVVEELKKQSDDAGQLVDSYISGKIMQLKEQIATLEKREERYKTVFADRISVFRRACCELFGYKIVMDDRQRPNGIPVTRFTLQSIYAQSDEEKLEFEYESGNTKILVNDYTKQPDISQQVEVFIRKLNSIPAFTANLTVESFNRRTLS